jgi:hypothetical protein
MIDKESNEEEVPKLSIEQENEFKKIKLSLENDAIFGAGSKKLPPEIEGQWLDYVTNFENAYKNAKQITVFEKLGSPKYKKVEEIKNDFDFTEELHLLNELLSQKNISLDVLCDYENESKLIYTFIVGELFNQEIDDMNVEGMVTRFTYEEFHPNDEYDIENDCENFITMFLNTKSKLYDEYHSKDALNHEALHNFRSLFSKFKIKYYKYGSALIINDDATAHFNIDFSAKIKGTEAKILYSGDGTITFKRDSEYWYVQEVNLPILD